MIIWDNDTEVLSNLSSKSDNNKNTADENEPKGGHVKIGRVICKCRLKVMVDGLS